MSDNTSENSDVYNLYLKIWTATEEDFKRVFTEEELKELCLKHKCKVNMSRYNIVHDYQLAFTESGRFQKWSARDRLRMLAKAVNKKKPSVLYTEEEIIKDRRRLWEDQLKENILSLNYWKRQRTGNPRLQLSESDDLPSQLDTNTDSMNPDVISTQTVAEDSQVEYIQNSLRCSHQEVPSEVATESLNLAETEETNMESGKKSETEEIYEGLVDCLDDAEYLFNDEPKHSEETDINNKKKQVSEALSSEDVAPGIQNMYDLNTISMSIDSPISTQSEDVISQNYENFKNIMPLTSTQSQNHE